MIERTRILSQARRRMLVDRSTRGAAIGLLAGAVGALLVVLLDRLLAAQWSWTLFACICAVGLAAGLVVGLVRTPGRDAVAVHLDAALGLKDRLGTAASIDAQRLANGDAQFIALARHDADRLAKSIDVRPATPLDPPARTLGGALLTCAALAAAILWLPAISWAEPDPLVGLTEAERTELEEARSDAGNDLESVVEDLRSDPPDAASADDLSALDQLAEQLGRSDLPPNEFETSRDEAAARLDELARDVAEQAQRDEAVLDQLDEQFQTLNEPTSEGADEPTLTDALRDALAEGDYERAAEISEEIERRIGELDETQQRELAEAMREMADQIEDARQHQAAAGEMRDNDLRDRLREQGLDDEQIDDLLNKPDEPEQTDPHQPDDTARKLEEQGVDPKIARDLADEMDQREKDQRTNNEAEQRSRDVSEALDEAAEKIDPPPEAESGNPDRPEPTQSGDETQSPDGDHPSEQQGPDQQEDIEQAEDTADDGQQQGEQQQRTDEGRETDTDDAQTEQTQGETEQRETTEGDPEGDETTEQEQPTTDPNEQAGDEQQSTQGNDQQIDPQARSEEQTDSPQEQPGGDQPPRDFERLREAMRQMKEQQNGAEQSREQAEKLKDAARRMAERMTPDERKQMEEWSRQLAEQHRDEDEQEQTGSAGGDSEPGESATGTNQTDPAPGNPPGFDDVDLRDDDDPQRTIAEWLADDRLEGDPGRTAEPGGTSPVRQARRAAERAVNDSTLPRRYHDLIERYFGRFQGTVEKARDRQEGSANGASQEDNN